MALLPDGTFPMGDRRDTVRIQAFCMDLTEVTAGDYESCVGNRACNADHLREWTPDGSKFMADSRCNYGLPDRWDHPINCVSWDQSAMYCQAHGKRLPTEEEWEWAARGDLEGRTYPWGNKEPESEACWSPATPRRGTCAVGTNPAGDAKGGIHDLAGNVWEWTSSLWSRRERVIRGGCWYYDNPSSLRAAFRSRDLASYRAVGLGFRCVATPLPRPSRALTL